jgi:NIPSNAP
MFRIDRSARVMPGKNKQALAEAKRNAAFVTQNTSVAAPTEVFLEVLGNVGTVHWILQYESLAAYENSLADLRENAGWQEILTSGASAFVPGSLHDTGMVSVAG